MRNYYINNYDCKIYTENEKKNKKYFIPGSRWFLVGMFKSRRDAYAEILSDYVDVYHYLTSRPKDNYSDDLKCYL